MTMRALAVALQELARLDTGVTATERGFAQVRAAGGWVPQFDRTNLDRLRARRDVTERLAETLLDGLIDARLRAREDAQLREASR